MSEKKPRGGQWGPFADETEKIRSDLEKSRGEVERANLAQIEAQRERSVAQGEANQLAVECDMAKRDRDKAECRAESLEAECERLRDERAVMCDDCNRAMKDEIVELESALAASEAEVERLKNPHSYDQLVDEAMRDPVVAESAIINDLKRSVGIAETSLWEARARLATTREVLVVYMKALHFADTEATILYGDSSVKAQKDHYDRVDKYRDHLREKILKEHFEDFKRHRHEPEKSIVFDEDASFEGLHRKATAEEVEEVEGDL